MKKRWLLNMRVKMASPGLLKSCDAKKKIRIMSKRMLTPSLILMTMVGMMVDWMKM